MLPPIKIIEQTFLTATAASVSFSSFASKIPAGSRHLVLIWNARSDRVLARDVCLVRLNGDVGATYNSQRLTGLGAVPAAFQQTGGTSFLCPEMAGGTAPANVFGGGYAVLPDAFNAADHKSIVSFGGAAEDIVVGLGGRWADEDAITSVTFAAEGGTLQIGSYFAWGVVDEDMLQEEIILSVDGTFTFSSLPSTSGDLVAVGKLRTDRANTLGVILEEFNGDAAAGNYARQAVRGTGAGALAFTGADQQVGVCTGALATAKAFGAFISQIYQFGRSVNDPHKLSICGYHESSAPESFFEAYTTRRNNIEPVTSILYRPGIGTNFKAGSMMSLYFVPKRARLVRRVVLQVDAPSVVFAGIPQDFDGDQVLGYLLHAYTRTDKVDTVDGILFEFNGDAVAANYDKQRLFGSGVAITASQSAADRAVTFIPAANSPANVFGGGTVFIPVPIRTDRHKQRLEISGTGGAAVHLSSSRWENLAAITSIILAPETGPNFLAGSVFELEAIVIPSADTTHLTFGPGHEDDTQNVVYLGTWKSFPTIALTGPMLNPRIDNLTTGEHIELATTIAAGRVVTITLAPQVKTVVDDLGTNLLGTVTPDSDLGTFHLEPNPGAPAGVNQIRVRFFAADPGVSRIDISWLVRYFGI